MTASTPNIEELIDQIKADEANSATTVDSIDASFSELAGVSSEELQKFLEEQVGLNPDEGVQGTFVSVVVTPATHC
ncbi:thioviridamide family RiPP peptide [Streptomyces sp. UNOB3_S3]|uniref:thioviridamide family RiPP peptide n=1 Tax=Streptomyces sp. UNOB3_S3 TaxID=2871682 RepID=UPI001E2FBFC1|nr:thioviridamide family RiPP peptide [Streptomyces sp. UNOB3_S3]MCC3776576.1 thioviridamide family RiPP peptide [Streptomyces sp. UNOB3_S3]